MCGKKKATMWSISLFIRTWIVRYPFFILAVVCILPIAWKIVYDNSNLQEMNQLEVTLQHSRCCKENQKGSNESVDMCGRSGCLWPCNFESVPKYELFNITEEQAFFLETSESPSLNYRQACAVESLIYRNPNLKVNLLMFSQHMDINSATMKTLHHYYPSLQITKINPADYIIGSPLEKWYFCTNWKNGSYAVVHLSDALRLLSLSKFGGYYFDLDIIHLRPVTPHRNFVVNETEGLFGNSVIHADSKYRRLMQMAVEEFASTYRGDAWGYNGPDLLVRVLQEWCNVNNISMITSERCAGFRILPPQSFFPFYWYEWEEFFYETPIDKLNWGNDVIAAHVWNKFSAGTPAKKNSNQLYVQMTRSSCPHIYNIAPEQF